MRPIETEIAANYEAAKQAWKANRNDKTAEGTLRTWEKLQRMVVSINPAVVAEAKKQAAALLEERDTSVVAARVKKAPPVVGEPVVVQPVGEAPNVKPTPKKRAAPKGKSVPKKATPKKK